MYIKEALHAVWGFGAHLGNAADAEAGSLLPPCGLHGSNLGPQAWCQAP